MNPPIFLKSFGTKYSVKISEASSGFSITIKVRSLGWEGSRIGVGVKKKRYATERNNLRNTTSTEPFKISNIIITDCVSVILLER